MTGTGPLQEQSNVGASTQLEHAPKFHIIMIGHGQQCHLATINKMLAPFAVDSVERDI